MERKLKIIVNELFERKEVKTSYERLFGIWYMNSEKDSVWNTIDNDFDEYKFQQMKKERNEYFINKIINNKISSMGIS